MSMELIQRIAIFALPLVLAITVHEASHGYVARYFGDRTAEMLGRLTLNPLKHIDPIGTVVLPLMLLAFGAPFIFGYAKPVPVAVRNLRNPRRDMAIVAAAGPGSNILMAIGWALVIKVATYIPGSLSVPLQLMGQAGVFINILLAVLNMVPIPPLDGGRVASALLPARLSMQLDRIDDRIGMLIVLGLLITGILWTIIRPVIQVTAALVLGIVGL